MDDAHSLAAFRRTFGTSLGELAEEHYRHDLTDSDRALLLRSASTLSLSTTVGSLTGLSLGLLLAIRLRRNRARLAAAFRSSPQMPISVSFADGRTEALPDISGAVKPSRLGNWAAYIFFSAGGLFIGGEVGLVAGGMMTRRGIAEDSDARQRIQMAFRKFRAEALRKQADQVESGTGYVGF